MSLREPYEGISPIAIDGDAEHKAMTITWNDGHQSRLTYEWLRWNCPCAQCAGEGDAPGSLQFTSELQPEQTTLEDLEMVGSYGMTPVWADGHHTGIYTFRNLRGTCPCPTCESARRLAPGSTQ
ncbi:MAG TPA: DUF971 domain-containing protein [Chloroflexota bacterium]|nr:DUF971 domain-containing protein [Chloroflexota bacterium]